MNYAHSNLFSRLHQLIHRQDENFFTESLVHLLRYLQRHDPTSAARLLQHLCGMYFTFSSEQMGQTTISTQASTDQGRPDIEIRMPQRRIFVEVKMESGLGYQQLERYREVLSQSAVSETMLVLLSQYRIAITHMELSQSEQAGRYTPTLATQWHQIGHWLEAERPLVSDPVSRYLIEQFLEFMGERGIVMEAVSWELKNGIDALRNLLAMMTTAMDSMSLEYKRLAAWDWKGFGIGEGSEKNHYYFYVSYANPGMIYFQTANRPILPERASTAEDGLAWEESSSSWPLSRGWRWERALDLTAEEVHFFARSKASQIECVTIFLKDSLSIAQELEQPLDDTDAAIGTP